MKVNEALNVEANDSFSSGAPASVDYLQTLSVQRQCMNRLLFFMFIQCFTLNNTETLNCTCFLISLSD